MAIAMRGLKDKPSYEQLVGVATSGGLGNIKFPNRDASFLRNGFIFSQLDGEGMRQMQLQQEQASKQAFKDHLLKQIAINTGSNLSDLRNQHEADLRIERVNQALTLIHNFIIYHKLTRRWKQIIAYRRARKQSIEMICQHAQYHTLRRHGYQV